MPEGWDKRVVNMTPKQYIKMVSNELGVDSDYLINQRKEHTDKTSVEDLRDLMKKGEKIDMPWIIQTETEGHNPYFQEGLHRMIATGEEYGYDQEVPVTLGYDSNETGIFKNATPQEMIDNFQKNKELFKQRKIDTDNLEKQNIINEVADWFGVKPSEVNEELIAKYDKEMDDIFEI